jgi:putative flippase GtrA
VPRAGEVPQNDGKMTVLLRIVKSELLRNILLYGIIGALASGVDLLLFSFLVYVVNYPALISNVLTVIVGITISFILNRKFNFRVTDRVIRRYGMFFCVGICGLVLSELILFVGSQVGIESFTVKLVSVFVVALFQFTLNRTISFRALQAPLKVPSDD